ncbi:hypothetical protein A9G35_09115 [Gilliamella sp. Choc5-1]|jgi:predicted proteasome-type protease|uniref:hypothetical protein n=1 Tax=Gilliamella sp. Choc5-1 TaxID=3120238 RepID=UPI00080DFF88|nr:hypothetical protein [Gilliamella apicola]OCG43945.1 hypothetical protein A9G35_09115 [Gilliamella apicola]
MSIFRIISITSGLILTVSSIYEAQKVVGKKCNEYALSTNQNIAARVITSFVVSAAIGGTISNVIKSIYK